MCSVVAVRDAVPWLVVSKEMCTKTYSGYVFMNNFPCSFFPFPFILKENKAVPDPATEAEASSRLPSLCKPHAKWKKIANSLYIHTKFIAFLKIKHNHRQCFYLVCELVNDNIDQAVVVVEGWSVPHLKCALPSPPPRYLYIQPCIVASLSQNNHPQTQMSQTQNTK
eukprot:m.94577 g.94577  ORF g.94577 m.94577 type:complete len:167 (-) comp8924_c0_seq5:68-568(-)